MQRPNSASLNPGPGFRVRQTFKRASSAICDKLGQIDSADISDELNRLYTMSHNIKNLVNSRSFAGPALTVKVFPGDNLMVHKAIDLAEPGDVLVVDAGGSTTNAVLGDIIAAKLKHRGVIGVIVDGLIRDITALREVDLPVFARGVSPIGPLHRGPGEVNYTVSCGGIVVSPGDVIVADESGVVALHSEFAQSIYERLSEKLPRQSAYVANVRAGKFSNEWVDEILDREKCLKR